jgi:hypothetical protein
MGMIVFAALTLSAADGEREQAIRLARETLAREGTVANAAAAAVAEVTAVTWPDSSLGCPVAGIVYTPSVIAGYRVRLQSDAAIYTVHVGSGRAVLCEPNDAAARSGGAPIDGKNAGRSVDDALRGLKLAEQARSTLAARLAVASEQVRIESYRATVWPDAGLGCDEAGVTRMPQPTKGFRILLRAGDRAFEFHSDLTRVVECPAAPPR